MEEYFFDNIRKVFIMSYLQYALNRKYSCMLRTYLFHHVAAGPYRPPARRAPPDPLRGPGGHPDGRGSHRLRHDGVNTAVLDMLQTVATGRVLLGDREGEAEYRPSTAQATFPTSSGPAPRSGAPIGSMGWKSSHPSTRRTAPRYRRCAAATCCHHRGPRPRRARAPPPARSRIPVTFSQVWVLED